MLFRSKLSAPGGGIERTGSIAASDKSSAPGVSGGNSVVVQEEWRTPTENGNPQARNSTSVAPTRNVHAATPPSTGASAFTESEVGESASPRPVCGSSEAKEGRERSVSSKDAMRDCDGQTRCADDGRMQRSMHACSAGVRVSLAPHGRHALKRGSFQHLSPRTPIPFAFASV